MKPEEILANQLATYLLEKYPKIPFRFDLVDKIGLRNGKKVKMLHGKWSRGYPDLFIATTRKSYGGLYLELKATNKVQNTEHTKEQSLYHSVLRKNGYKCQFCCGFDDCKKKIKNYLKSD